jgi:localization factor PodJL
MTSRVSWSVEGIEPSVRDRAEAAARRAGMSLNDWLNSTIGEPASAPRNTADVSEIHQRLDSITRQIEQISQTAAPKREGSGVARQLNDAISRLDARLSQISSPVSNPAPQPRPQPAKPAPQPPQAAPPQQRAAPERPAAPVYRQAPTTIPELLDFDVAEIVARQSQLNGEGPRTVMASAAPPIAPQMPAAPDLSGFEKQLQYLTSQIEGLRRPDGLDQAINTFRSELAEMRQAITEALPRRAVESLETEIRSVARRIDESRQNGVDGGALQSVEQALRDIHITLRTLTPAEQLAGFDDAIRNLGGKIDMIVRTSSDSGSMQQLEGAIGALRTIVSNVASNEALSRLSDDVQTLASKVEQLSQSGGFSGSLAALEQRIAMLTTALEARERPADDSNHLEAAVRMLSDRIDHLQVGSDSSAAFAHVEQRVMQLLERLETADTRPANFGRVEEGLSDILRHLEQQRVSFAALSESRPAAASAMDQDFAGAIRRELSDMRLSQTETDRHTQDALESVHNTLGHVVDRLAMIEGDLRSAKPSQQDRPGQQDWFSQHDRFAPQAAPVAPIISSTAISAPMAAQSRPIAAPASPSRPELPNPAVFHAAPAQPPAPSPANTVTPAAIQDILSAAVAMDDQQASAMPAPMRGQSAPRTPIDPNLPPDTPLEPGTRPQDRVAAAPTPSQRIAASEDVLSEIPSAAREAASTSSFIAAARRAAQAASNPAKDAKDTAKTSVKTSAKDTKPGRVAALNNAARANAQAAKGGSNISSKIRSLLVGASVVVIVLSGFKMAMTMFEGSETPPAASIEKPVEKPLEKSSDASPSMAPEAHRIGQPAAAELTLPSITSPIPINRQSRNAPAVPVIPPAADNASVTAPAESKPAAADVTGTVTVPQPSSMSAITGGDRKPPVPAAPATFTPVSDTLPATIGGAVLRTAALKGDPAAAYEVAVRFAEGKGVAVNYDEAAKWYDRAADGGIVPAMFRLGTLYEKGLGGKKDVDAAKRYYIRAAERGNAKAMHNLAVLDADGGNKGPNYKSASEWFRKAAERGVADSQFNLGILYARGIGVEQNLAESFKWFSLAAAQGDADSGRKRDDVAKRLDAQSLAAAKLAIQTFVAEGQPDDAINVTAPAGGWDAVPTAAAPAAKHAATKPANKQSASAR